jgi:hypothetical protein
MGYTTQFQGEFALDKPLSKEHLAYLKAFSRSRRMTMDEKWAATMPDPVRDAVGLPVGADGKFCVWDADGMYNKYPDDISNYIRYNKPPSTQPGLWCDWEPSADGLLIRHNGSEKFYDYIEWLIYLIDNFLIPWGYTLSGDVDWVGEDLGDRGCISVVNNAVSTFYHDTNTLNASIITEEDIVQKLNGLDNKDEAISRIIARLGYDLVTSSGGAVSTSVMEKHSVIVATKTRSEVILSYVKDGEAKDNLMKAAILNKYE